MIVLQSALSAVADRVGATSVINTAMSMAHPVLAIVLIGAGITSWDPSDPEAPA